MTLVCAKLTKKLTSTPVHEIKFIINSRDDESQRTEGNLSESKEQGKNLIGPGDYYCYLKVNGKSTMHTPQRH